MSLKRARSAPEGFRMDGSALRRAQQVRHEVHYRGFRMEASAL